MNVACPECRSVFRVDPSKLPASTLKARCSICGGLITITPATSVRDEFAGPARSTAADSKSIAAIPSAVRVASAPGVASAVASAPPSPVLSPPSATSPSQQTVRADVSSSSGASAVGAAGIGPTTAAALLGSAAPATPAAPGARSPTPPPRSPSPSRPVLPFVRPGAGAGPSTSATQASPFAGRVTPPSSPNAPRRPINPFLANDPNAKARRLARALISDMITYFPEKREEGLRNGTLKQMFEEEITKSYGEYVEQVGREFAETTPHFQDALNEILAGGRKLF